MDSPPSSDDFDPYYKWLGIPPAEQPPHHYRLLGINIFESDIDVVSNAADQRMVHLRAYQSGRYSALSQKLLNEIAAARICLLEPARKAAYDETLRAKLASDGGVEASPAPVTTAVPPPPLPTAVVPAAVVAAAEVPADATTADVVLQQRQQECQELFAERRRLRKQSWLALAAIGHALAVQRLRVMAQRFPAERAGLALVVVLAGLALGVVGMALFTMSGLLLLGGAMFGTIIGAALASHGLFVPSDEAMKRYERSQRQSRADAPERLREVNARLADARRRLAEAQKQAAADQCSDM